MTDIMRVRLSMAGGVAAAVLASDLITKQVAAAKIAPFTEVQLLPFLNLVNVRNTGAAFGMMSGMGNIFFISLSLLAAGFIIYLLIKGEENPLALGLILGGAFGNLYDRLALGSVRDFIDFHVGGWHWPAFNIADSGLTVGIAVLLLGAILHGSHCTKESGCPPPQNTPQDSTRK